MAQPTRRRHRQRKTANNLFVSKLSHEELSPTNIVIYMMQCTPESPNGKCAYYVTIAVVYTVRSLESTELYIIGGGEG